MRRVLDDMVRVRYWVDEAERAALAAMREEIEKGRGRDHEGDVVEALSCIETIASNAYEG